MNPYLILTIIGIIVKIWAAYRLRQHWQPSTGMIMCFIFLFFAYAQSTLELYGYFLLAHPEYNQLLALKIYYIFTCALLLMVPLLHAALLGNRFNMIITALCATWFALLSGLILYTDIIIADVIALPYMLTREKGDYHIIYSLTVITALCFALGGLVKIYRHTEDDIEKIKAGNLLIAFVPITSIIAVLLILMAMELPITAAGIAPLLLAIYIYVLYENLQRETITDLSVYLPWTEKARHIRMITKPFRVYSKEPDMCKDLPDEYKALLIDRANELFDKQKEAAAWLGLTESQMSRLKKKHAQQLNKTLGKQSKK